MSINAAQLMVTVGANTAAAEQGIAGFARLLGPGGVLGLGALGAAAAIAGIGIASTKMAGDFQAGMMTIATGAGENANNIGKLSTGVLQLARDTGTSTKQLTAGLYMIESGGYRLNTPIKAMDILRAAAEGAKVGVADLGTVADATDTVLKNYGDTGLTASQAVNVLIDTVKHGKTHMEDLAGALAHVLPTAAAAGVSIQDVMGAMATMTGEGVDAANAATYLRQTMIALEAPTKASQQALAGVGLSAAQLNAGMRISLPDTIAMITNAIGKKFPVAAQAAAAEMAKVQNHTETFAQAVQHLSGQGGAMSGYMEAIRNISGGSRQMQGMLLLSSSHTATFKANADLLAKSAHTAGDTINGWALVQGTFNQHMDVLKQIVETLMIQLGTKLLPIASQLADVIGKGLTGAVDALTGKSKGLTTGFGGELLGAAKSLAGFFVSDVLPTIKQLAGFIEKNVMPILHTWAEVIIKNVLPVVLNLAHIILTKWLPPLERIVARILPILTPLLQALGWVLGNVVGPILGAVAGLVGDLLDILDVVIGKIIDYWTPQFNAMAQVFKLVIGPAIKNVSSAIGGLITDIGNLIGGIGRFISSPTVKNFQGIMKDIANAGSGVTNLMTGGAFSKFLPKFASGGTMDVSGLALVGEAGPEIVRLPGGAQVTPIAQMAGGGPLAPLPGGSSAGGQMTIVVQLKADGRQLARVVVPHIHTIIRGATGQRAM